MTSDSIKPKYIRPPKLAHELANFSKHMAVTTGHFEITVPGFLKDMEWNHMDQMHRPFIHGTYDDNIRLATGQNFALSLTKWGRLPMPIVVSDMRLKPGLYYQSMTLLGILYVHNVISMEQREEAVYLSVQWHITSHKLFKSLHVLLDRRFYKLNTRLQVEDAVIRSQRYQLRKDGYQFASDPPDYITSNQLTNNTIYPRLNEPVTFDVAEVSEGKNTSRQFNALKFTVTKRADNYLIWPAVCPHEGGDLSQVTPNDQCRVMCPWHGLKFSSVALSPASPSGEAYGYQYLLKDNNIQISSAA